MDTLDESDLADEPELTPLADEFVDALLERIGAPRPARPTLEALREIHRLHVLSVPFENLDVRHGKPIQFGVDAFGKIVLERRGGICYEQNGLLGLVLRALGYGVTVIGARIFENGVFGPVMGHLLLTVTAEDSPESWLVDTGYGRAFVYPLRFESREPQTDPQGEYQLVDAPHGDVDLLRDGELQYRVEPRPRSIDDFKPIAWWFETAAESTYTNRLWCSLVTAAGRVSIVGTTLIRWENGKRTKDRFATEAEGLAAYRALFGIELPTMPALAPRIASAEPE